MKSNRGSKHRRKQADASPAGLPKARSPRASPNGNGRNQAVAGKWLVWNREQTRIVACGPTRAAARAAAAAAGELATVLENVAKHQRAASPSCTLVGAELRQQWCSREEGEPLTEADVSTFLGIAPGAVEERRAAGSLVAVPVEGGVFLYPCWQFTERGTLPGLPEVLTDLRLHNPHPLAQVRFFLSRNLRLNEETPLAALRQGRVEDVRQAACAYGEHGAA